MTKRVYLAGPMTGIEYFNFPAFDAERDYMEGLGWDVFSPADHDRKLLGYGKTWYPKEKDTEGPWKKWDMNNPPSLREMLGADLEWIAKNANAIVMLPGWENSRGAKAEWALAVALDLKIIYR